MTGAGNLPNGGLTVCSACHYLWCKCSCPCHLKLLTPTSVTGSNSSENVTIGFDQLLHAASRAPLWPAGRSQVPLRCPGGDKGVFHILLIFLHSTQKDLPSKSCTLPFILYLYWKIYLLFHIVLNIFYWIFQSSKQ